VDCLENRRLLSASGHVGDAADTGRAVAREVSAMAPRGDAAPSSSAIEAAAQAVDRSGPAGEGDAGASPIVTAISEGDAVSGESRDISLGASSIQQAFVNAAARQPTSVDPTPWDEGAAGATAEAPSIEQSGGGGALIVASAGPVGVAASTSAVTSAGPSMGAAPAPGAAATVGASVMRGGDTSIVGEIGPDRSLLANIDATRLPTQTTPGHPASFRALDPPAHDLTSAAAEGDGGAPAVGDEPRPVGEPAPSHCADLLTEFLPFSRASLEDAVDRFLAPFDGLGSELVHWQSSASLIPAATAIAAALLAREVVRRRARAGTEAREERQEEFARFPGYPVSWGFAES
jgi:hypothetical protein